MATQIGATAGVRGRRLKRNQIAELEAKMGSLGEIERQKMQKKMHAAEMAFQERSLAQDVKHKKKTLEMRELAAERGMGVSALKFGANMALGSEGKTLSHIGSKIKGGLAKIGIGGSTQVSAGGAKVGSPRFGGQATAGGAVNQPGPGGAIAGTKSGFFGNLQPGSILGGGLAGFGASRMVKGKGKRMLLGAGVGGLMSLFGGGGFDLANVAGGALFGGLGGLV
jgi:hypothetical protein